MKQFRSDVVILSALVVLLLVGGAWGDVLVTNGGSRYEGTVTDNGDSYTLVKANGGKITLPKVVVREVIKTGDAPAKPAVKPGGASSRVAPAVKLLSQKVLAAARTVGAGMRELKARHAEERKKAQGAPDPDTIKQAAKKVGLIKQGIAAMKRAGSPAVGVFGADGKGVQVTRRTARQQLREAEGELAEAKAGPPLPPELLARQKEELDANAALQKRVALARGMVSKCASALRAAGDDSAAFDRELAKWRAEIDRSLPGAGSAPTTILPEKQVLPPCVKAAAAGKLSGSAAFAIASVCGKDAGSVGAAFRKAGVDVTDTKKDQELPRFMHPGKRESARQLKGKWPRPTGRVSPVELKILMDGDVVGDLSGFGSGDVVLFATPARLTWLEVQSRYGKPKAVLDAAKRGERLVSYGRVRMHVDAAGKIQLVILCVGRNPAKAGPSPRP